MVLFAKQIDIERENDFWRTVFGVKESVLQNGIDKDELNAIINKMEFSVKEVEEPKALGRNMYAMTTWICGGDPMILTPKPKEVFFEAAVIEYCRKLCWVLFE